MVSHSHYGGGVTPRAGGKASPKLKKIKERAMKCINCGTHKGLDHQCG